MNIPVMKPRLATFEEVSPFLRRIDQSNVYSNHGPLVCELEAAYSRFLNTDKELVVALANATQAIQGLISISKNMNWIVPDYTFSATGLAVVNSGRNLYLSDVNSIDWKIDVRSIADNQKSFGVIPVMPFGAQIDFDPYTEFDEVIIDAAASLGAAPPDFNGMKKDWAVVYSLHATKVLGAGEGSIVICGNHDQAEMLRVWSNFGFSLNRTSEIQGTNAKMSEISAAYALASLSGFEQEQKEWLDVQSKIRKQIVGTDFENVTTSYSGFNPYWIIQLQDSDKLRNLQQLLDKSGIGTRKWWPHRISEMPGIESKKINETTNSIKLVETILGLPKFRDLESKDIERIFQIIR